MKVLLITLAPFASGYALAYLYHRLDSWLRGMGEL